MFENHQSFPQLCCRFLPQALIVSFAVFRANLDGQLSKTHVHAKPITHGSHDQLHAAC
jgi:hypothetical protein